MMPDFTQGDTIPSHAKHDWNLGPTGLRGWMFCDKHVTTDARQIAITAVDKSSPAHGVIEVGDVLLGAGKKPFSFDPRTELGRAISGYGMMNAPGLPLTIGLVMARDAGVKDPEVAESIELSARLMRFYLGKGAVPYGDHPAWTETHEDNGKCGLPPNSPLANPRLFPPSSRSLIPRRSKHVSARATRWRNSKASPHPPCRSFAKHSNTPTSGFG